MRRNSERVAWTVLLGAFAVWCALLVAVPLGLRWWLRNAATDQVIRLTPNGTVLVQRPGRPSSEVNLADIPIGSSLLTQPDSQAVLTLAARDGRTIFATLLAYGNTEFAIIRADTPRYSTGANPNQIDIEVKTGRVRVFIGVGMPRETMIRVRSPAGAVTELHQPGTNLSVEAAAAQSIVTVREGDAIVIALSQGVVVRRDERAEVLAGQPPSGPLPAERNLIANGDFQQPLEAGWSVLVRQPQDPSEHWGEATIVSIAGRRAANLLRSGQNWGEVGLTQEINKDLRDFKSLRLQMDVLISLQDLYNCGQQGTECPVMVKIKYLDTGGGEREWLQGFYYNFNPSPSIPRGCASCAPPVAEHIRVTAGQWTTYETGNLLDAFRANGLPATVIKSISLYGSGHTFNSLFTDIQLLAAE